MRQFETGATRNSDEGALDYEAFLSPIVLKRFAEYMEENAVQADGQRRSGDNWQNGIPIDSYMDSLLRHVIDVWLEHRGFVDEARSGGIERHLCATMFNAMGMLFELLKEKRRINPQPFAQSEAHDDASEWVDNWTPVKRFRDDDERTA